MSEKKTTNSTQEQWRIIDIIKWGSDYFAKKGIDSPRLNTELILSNVLNISRFDLYKSYDKPLINEELHKVKALIKRRLNREPIQYILGEAYFLGRKFYVDNSSLIPRPETELIVTLALQCPNKYKTTILDIGTGCGCIAISLAINLPTSLIYAIDNNQKSLELAQKNAQLYGINNIIFEKIDILKELPSYQQFDIILSNPPYISLDEYNKLEPELYFEPKDALSDNKDGLSFYYRFVEIFPKLLCSEGIFFVEIGYNQFETVKDIFQKNNFKINVTKDFNGIPRVISNKL